jgi:hypothetical protein
MLNNMDGAKQQDSTPQNDSTLGFKWIKKITQNIVWSYIRWSIGLWNIFHKKLMITSIAEFSHSNRTTASRPSCNINANANANKTTTIVGSNLQANTDNGQINIKNTKFVKNLPMIDVQFRFNQCNSFREEEQGISHQLGRDAVVRFECENSAIDVIINFL